jgi:hypothetical protein
VCDATTCKLSCTATADCAAGYYCKSGSCALLEDTLGVACADGSACKTGFCVDGVCCATAGCDAGSSCAVGDKKGRCSKLAGAACLVSDQCGSGFCVDGVCCDRACDGQCEACDTPTAKGKCQGVVGAPHGTRPKCDTGGTDPCKAMQCDGAKDPKSCVGFAAGPTEECKPASCAGGSLTAASTCDGKGACVTPTQTSCAPYACSGSACRTSCAADTDCSDGFECDSGTCIAKGARCTSDGISSTSKEGVKSDCTPYRCGTSGTCLSACATTDDCAPGKVCQTDKTCVDPTVQPVDNGGGGCALGASTSSSALALGPLGVLLAFGLARRRRR